MRLAQLQARRSCVTGAPATWRFLVRLVAVIAVLLGSLQIGLPPVGATSSSKAPTTTAAPSLDCTYDRAPEVAQKLVEPMGFPNAGEWTAADGYLGNLPAPAIRQASVIAAEDGVGALSGATQANVDNAIERAAAGKVRFTGHDGKPYLNSDGLLPEGEYTEWTAAEAGAKRGADRVIIEGDPANPSAIYYWDHVNPPVRIR